MSFFLLILIEMNAFLHGNNNYINWVIPFRVWHSHSFISSRICVCIGFCVLPYGNPWPTLLLGRDARRQLRVGWPQFGMDDEISRLNHDILERLRYASWVLQVSWDVLNQIRWNRFIRLMNQVIWPLHLWFFNFAPSKTKSLDGCPPLEWKFDEIWKLLW